MPGHMMKNTVLMAAALAALAGGCKKKAEDKPVVTPGSAVASGSDMAGSSMAGSGSAGSGSAAAGSGSAVAKGRTPEDMQKFFEACWAHFNDAKWGDFKNCYAADAVGETPGLGAPPLTGNTAITDYAKAYKAAFPDMTGEIQFEMISGNTIIAATLTHGTNSAAMKLPGMPEMPATNKKSGNYFTQVIELDDAGKVKHEWDFYDLMTTMGQINPQKGAQPVRAAIEKLMGPKEVVVTKDDDKEKANLATAAKFFEAFNKHDAKAVGDLADDKLVWSEAANAKDDTKAEFLKSIEGLWKSFSNVKFTVGKSWAAGDYVAHVASFDGTNDGDGMMGKKTGKKISEPFLQIEKIEGGKLTMAWVIYQNMGFMMQMGMMPQPSPPPAAGSGSAK